MSGERAVQAFRRLLVDAERSAPARVDALIALAQRSLVVPASESDELFTLTSDAGDQALAVFSGLDELARAGVELGWADAAGFVPHRILRSTQVAHEMARRGLARLVLDVTAPHALTVELYEIAALVDDEDHLREGPFAGVGRISSELLERTTRPSETPPRGSYRSDPAPATSRSAPPLASGVKLEPLIHTPPNALLGVLRTLLKQYPEVEWAAFCHAQSGSFDGPAIGLRVDTAYRTRLRQIAADLRHIGAQEDLPLEVILLDDPGLARRAREGQYVFYPWESPSTRPPPAVDS